MAETGAAFEALTYSLSPDIIETWKKQEKRPWHKEVTA